MTTILMVRTKDAVYMGADSRVCEGNIKLPDDVEKISIINDGLMVSSCGEVGFLQQLVKQSIKEIKIDKVINDDDSDISVDELSKQLALKNFNFPLMYRRYVPNSFLVAGLTQNLTLKGYMVGSDGACLEVRTFACDGSGGVFAQSILRSRFNPEATPEEIIQLIHDALTTSSRTDIYTNKNFLILSLQQNQEGYFFLKRWEVKETPEKEIEKPIEEAKEEVIEKVN
jgi:20S proteasome alpha/beta subunit